MKKKLDIAALAVVMIASLAMPFAAQAQSATTPTTTPPTTGAQAYQFNSDGIYGCNRTSAAASSVGAFTASGSYVPVADAAVELNTGYLVYLDCTLNPLVSALSASATAGLTQKALTSYNTGNNGNPQFSVNLGQETQNNALNSWTGFLTNGLGSVNPSLQTSIRSALAQGAAQQIENPSASLACPYSGNLNTLITGQNQTNVLSNLLVEANPNCNPLWSNEFTYELGSGIVSSNVNNMITLLNQGQGTYPITTTDQFGNVNVVTPGAVVLSQLNQALQSGFQKTESAVAIGQMVSALFAGIGTQAISSTQGLAGITQSTGGQPSYISQVVTAASQGVQTDATNAAITTLNGVLTTVTSYKSALDSIAQDLIQTISSLQGAESQCWNNIIQNVCVAGSIQVNNGVETCTQIPGPGTTVTTTDNGSSGRGGTSSGTITTIIPPAPITLKIATSTAFSYDVIHSGASPSIAAQAQSVATQIQSADTSLDSVNQLIAGVTDTTSQDAQSLALQQLDQLVASNSFPSPTAISTATQEATGISQEMSTLLNQTIQTWEGFDSNGTQDLSWDQTVSATTVGWCNYNDPKTLAEWEGVWKQ